MTNSRTPSTPADASKLELTEEQLNTVSGGAAALRDGASGLAMRSF
jgi:bacteriocin-like protein